MDVDRFSWDLEDLKVFSVKSLYSFVGNGNPLSKVLPSGLWKSSCPRKVSILLWILSNGNLNTSVTMQKNLANFSLQPSIYMLFVLIEQGESRSHILSLLLRLELLVVSLQSFQLILGLMSKVTYSCLFIVSFIIRRPSIYGLM